MDHEQERQPWHDEDAARSADFIDTERELAREQMNAAWQLHIEQLQEQLEKGWREHVSRAVDERFEALRERFEEELERRSAVRAAEEAARSRALALRAVSELLNQTARRLDQSTGGDSWASALLDGAGAFTSRAILFSVAGDELQYEDHRSEGSENLSSLIDVRIPLAQAPAFAGVLETMDAVICMATPGEISLPLAGLLEGVPERRASLLPIVIGQSEGNRRVTAVLYAEGGGEPLDVNVLEVITTLAGATLDSRQAARRPVTAAPAGGLMGIAPAGALQAVPPPGPPPSSSGDAARMPRDEQELHARAQRFARVRVAEMRLYQAQAVRRGREESCLYAALRGEMERGRAQFKHEFMIVPSMIDYFHTELVRTLANDDATLLGPDYPGPLA
ncbi:MAG: hypothetical protein HY858_02150 [Candidatus Solibacter usitatus]|nr:hypothetical protein [Candidatus Solibacter usitatus]